MPPKTARGSFRKMITGDGRRKPSLFGGSSSKKKKKK
jgi:hypothetical protein